jgi:hypothetical protein
MKKIFVVFILISSFKTFAQTSYWQQKTDYVIDVTLNDKTHSLNGFLELTYTNNSPDKLTTIPFHLWPNAYKNENTAFAKQLFRDVDGQRRWKAMKDKGSMDSLKFKVNNTDAVYEKDPLNIDIITLKLPSPLQPGEQIKITTPFKVKLPTYSSRMGHSGQSYMICQWYPKPAVYDAKGWHPMPYLDQGEFYSEFGTFKVNITLPAAYVVGASGVLQNGTELEIYKRIGSANNAAVSLTKYTPTATGVKTLSYVGENMHDFAWFADKNFIIKYDTLQLSSGKVIDAFAYHHAAGNKNWKNSIDYIESAVRHYSSWIGEYPYPVVAAVEGPVNEMSGGMEYPTITLITSPDANEEMLDAVITHEVGHNWFYGILGSNERAHAWMDEGLNTYYQFRYEAEKYKSNTLFGDAIPQDVRQQPLDEFLALIYTTLGQMPMEEAIDTHAASFKDKDQYAMVEYLKTSIWMYMMELGIGKQNLEKGMQDYFNEWKFKHPYPEDLKAALEKSTKKNLTEYFDILHKKGNL